MSNSKLRYSRFIGDAGNWVESSEWEILKYSQFSGGIIKYFVKSK